ncbi:hypothetical protein MTBLM5_10013 [Magnetospirillum sp. LM-5]|uniref:hypothetical protein n=1 Tax=Magnetospirillum sp. LM-5 TaxID=2681466 RepID=UPI00137FB881|nr:hypothetical protein [Magnetospirillum sp. LM-5]CAA7611346.1 hypothetical protein MTBLM5_10013 [Magnetospirillum sp. LM-5]
MTDHARSVYVVNESGLSDEERSRANRPFANRRLCVGLDAAYEDRGKASDEDVEVAHYVAMRAVLRD